MAAYCIYLGGERRVFELCVEHKTYGAPVVNDDWIYNLHISYLHYCKIPHENPQHTVHMRLFGAKRLSWTV